MSIYSYLAIPIGYLLGSIPSSYIIGRVWGKIDLRTEGDGRISAAAVKKRMGSLPFLIAVVMDVGKGIIATTVAKLLIQSPVIEIFEGNLPLVPMLILLITGMVAVIGHSWSPFINFRGGLGATVIYGVLCGTVFFPQELIALVIGATTILITHKSGFSTGVIIVTLFIVLLIQKLFWSPDMSPLLVASPLMLILVMLAKRFQLSKTRGIKNHDLLEYWKNGKE